MNRFIKTLLVLTVAALAFDSASLLAQNNAGGGGGRRNRGQGGGQGNFDPAQMRQRMLERTRQNLEITSDDEWKVISPLVEKVMTARRETMGGFGRGGRGGPRGGGGGGGGQGPELAGAMGELQKALDAKASNKDIQAKIAAVADERASREAALEQAQESLRKVLSVRQEGLAVLNGLLPARKQ